MVVQRGEPVELGPPGPEPSVDGRFDGFGGRYVPETLIPALEELDAA
ncbi:MAG: tryptophan synthase subunit beta, partial [Acidimicrobiia bacterium]